MISALDPGLRKGLSALGPYLDDIVLVGGWVPYLYGLMQEGGPAGRSPRTHDIDLAVPRRFPLRGPSVTALLESAGFACEPRSPVTRFIAAAERVTDDPVEIEFITDAPGARESVVAVQDGLVAQELHYVCLLLENTWSIELPAFAEGEAGLTVRFPSPGAFILQKGLAFRKRRDRLKGEKKSVRVGH
jgi:hypothetical protein